MSLMVCCAYVVCWTPNETAFFLTNFVGVAIDFSGWFYHFTMVLVLWQGPITAGWAWCGRRRPIPAQWAWLPLTNT